MLLTERMVSAAGSGFEAAALMMARSRSVVSVTAREAKQSRLLPGAGALCRGAPRENEKRLRLATIPPLQGREPAEGRGGDCAGAVFDASKKDLAGRPPPVSRCAVATLPCRGGMTA